MSKFHLESSLAASSLLAMALLPASAAFAKSENAAAVVKDEGCTGFIPTPSGGIGPLITTEKGHHRVNTSSGVAIVSCQFSIPRSEAPPRPLTAEGFECGVGEESTYDSAMLVTPGGRALMVCKLNGQR